VYNYSSKRIKNSASILLFQVDIKTL